MKERERDTLLNNPFDDCGCSEWEFSIYTLLIDRGSLEISRRYLQRVIPSVTNLVNLVMLSGMVIILISFKYNCSNTGK